MLSELHAKKEGIKLRKEIVEESDTVEKAIIEYAKKNNIDVTLIGTTGMSAAEEVFLGSIANNVIHHALCLQFADMFRFVCCNVRTILAKWR